LTDARLRQTMGIAARQTALRHSWDAIAKQISEIYEDIT